VAPSYLSELTRPGNVVFPVNLPFVNDLRAAGGRVQRLRSGHLIFYGPHNRRILATDPDGHPLHECEWGTTVAGKPCLVRARVRLDWGQWVGLKPEGLVNTTTLDLSRKPGWQQLRPDDLRQMAAQAMRLPLEAVKLFYGDDDLTINQMGIATIRHKKDAFYVLEIGTFESATFMACMSAMHWACIDFLPVVELFQSLLPGTGSAMFELIRGLYDDQNEGKPLPLRYRGIPTYPSEAAYKLFGASFIPSVPGGGDPFPIFMDVPRSHEVTWLPAPDPPLRYFDTAHSLCVTIRGGKVQKATKWDDPAGLPFAATGPGLMAPFERSVSAKQGTLVLKDRDTRADIPVQPSWGTLHESSLPTHPLAPIGWQSLFGTIPPVVTPHDAFSSVLLYPDDAKEIGELASQPFVADYLQDSFEQKPSLAALLNKANTILIDRFDAAITPCVKLDRPRTYGVRYRHPAYAQKQAQFLWQTLARLQRWDWIKHISFMPETAGDNAHYGRPIDLLYVWIPFAIYSDTLKLLETVRAVAGALTPTGMAFIAGPSSLHSVVQAQPLRILQAELVESLPTFRLHRTILPNARLKSDLTLYSLATA